MTKLKYNWEYLSLVRFLLAFIVLTGHLEHYIQTGYLSWYARFGSFEAILGFLLISGFSIGKSIQKNKGSYFKRRIERIYPVYLASIVLVYVVTPPAFSFSIIVTLLINILFLNQFLTNTSFVGPAWSLALEFWLYMLAPLLLKASYKLLLILITISFIAYCLYTAGRTKLHWPYYAGTEFGINLLLLSFIWIAAFGLAVHTQYFKLFAGVIATIFIVHWFLGCGIQFLSDMKHHQLHKFFTDDLITYLLRAVCLVVSYYAVIFNNRLPELSLFTKRIFHTLGNISYPLYLIHVSVFDGLKKYNILNEGVMIITSIIAAYLFYYIFDFYSRRRAIG